MAACQVQNSANGHEFDAGMEHWGTMQPMTFIDMKHANEEIGSNYDVAKPEGVKLTYNNGEDGRKTHILIPCDHAAGPGLPKPPIKNDVESPPGTYTIVFPSQYGCLLPQAPKIPQSLLGSIPLDHATELEYEECKRGSIWTHIWAVTTIFSMVAATYFWWKSSILEKEMEAFVPQHKGGSFVRGTTYGGDGGGVVSYQGQPSVGQRIANTDADNAAGGTSSWPPTSKAAGYHDL